MARPRPGSTEPADGGAAGAATPPYPPMHNQTRPEPHPQAQSVPYPPTASQSGPAEPYPPPDQSVPYPPVVDGTPVSFPPAGHAVTPPQNINIGGASPYGQPIGSPWSSGLFDCSNNETNAVMTAFLPCVTFGQIAEILDEGQTTCTLASFMYVMMVPALLTCWILGSNYRQRMRHKYGLVQAPYEDWATHLFCPCCALCQEYRELEDKGFDPSLGWMGHLARQQQTQTTPPTKHFMNN